MRFARSVVLILGSTSIHSCGGSRHSAPHADERTIAAPTPLVLATEAGERRVRRNDQFGTGAPFILKVDAQNGGSPDLVMGYEDIPPGRAIPAHRHLIADEIVFVHAGSGVVDLGDRSTPIQAGATIYIPRNVRVSIKNTGTAPLSIAFFFSKPGFEAFLRETSVKEGEPVVPLTRENLRSIRARHQWHTIYENP